MEVINVLADQELKPETSKPIFDGVFDAALSIDNNDAFKKVDDSAKIKQQEDLTAALKLDLTKESDRIAGEVKRSTAIIEAANQNQSIARDGIVLSSANQGFLDLTDLQKTLDANKAERDAALARIQQERELLEIRKNQANPSIENRRPAFIENPAQNTTNIRKQMFNSTNLLNDLSTNQTTNIDNSARVENTAAVNENLTVNEETNSANTEMKFFTDFYNNISGGMKEPLVKPDIVGGYTATNMEVAPTIPVSRIESKELVTNSEITKITKPANPVVESVNIMNREVGSKLEGVSQNISKSITSMTGGQTVNNSSSNSIDQSSNITNLPGETAAPKKEGESSNQPQIQTVSDLNEFYLSSIYEMLATGIKVKMSY